MKREPFTISGSEIRAGTRQTVHIPVSRRYSSADLHLPIHVIHGSRPGPTLFVSAAIHGDEINGVEIVRRLLRRSSLKSIRGTLIAVPILNVYGFLAQTRYLPDRRDLNRCFPGSPRGSLAGRLAHTFMTEVLSRATHGIDLHTGSLHRTNLPQIRTTLEVPGCQELAESFGAPVILDAAIRPGSLREAAGKLGVPVIIYEAGEALRFDEVAIRAGVRGVLSAMRGLDMLSASSKHQRAVKPVVAKGSVWVRAHESGILGTKLRLGARVEEGQVMGTISDPLGEEEIPIPAPKDGVLIGRTNLPLINEGDALFHLGVFTRPDPVADKVERFHEEIDPEY